MWQPNIIMVLEKKLKPTKIQILDEDSFDSFYQKVVKATGLVKPLLIRRNFTGRNPIDKLLQ